MQTQQLIQASADVVTITHLAPGDVYKRVEEGGAYAGGPGATLRFGIVQDVMNNGTDSAVTALEYVPAPAYASGGVTVEVKVWTGSKPAAIFAATPAEVTQHLAAVVADTDKAVDKAEAELTKARAAWQAVQEVVARAGQQILTAPATTGPAEVGE